MPLSKIIKAPITGNVDVRVINDIRQWSVGHGRTISWVVQSALADFITKHGDDPAP